MKAYRKPPPAREDPLEKQLNEMWPSSWGEPSDYMRRFILIFTRKAVREAEAVILNRVNVPRWADFDLETIN